MYIHVGVDSSCGERGLEVLPIVPTVPNHFCDHVGGEQPAVIHVVFDVHIYPVRSSRDQYRYT